jgi:hypothetical protein
MTRPTRDAYLLATVNELVAAILGEVILCQYLAAVLNLFACSILVFLRNAVRESILNKGSENGDKLFPRISLKFTFNL